MEEIRSCRATHFWPLAGTAWRGSACAQAGDNRHFTGRFFQGGATVSDKEPRLFDYNPETGILKTTVYLSPLLDEGSRITLWINVREWDGNPVIVGRSRSTHDSHLEIWSDGSIKVRMPSGNLLDMGKAHLTLKLETDNPFVNDLLPYLP